MQPEHLQQPLHLHWPHESCHRPPFSRLQIQVGPEAVFLIYIWVVLIFSLTISYFGWAGNALNCGKWWQKVSDNEFTRSGGGGYTQPCLHSLVLHSGIWSFLLLLVEFSHIHIASVTAWECCLQDAPVWNSLVCFFPFNQHKYSPPKSGNV